MNRFLISMIFASLQVQAASTDLCTQKKNQYGNNFISCNEVDWGVKPISADYQPSNSGPMTAAPSQISGVKNDYPGIKNTRYYSENSFSPEQPELKGLPLASMFYSSVAGDAKTNAEDPSLATWISKDWYNSLQPKTSTAGWEGKCATWSAWSMDPELIKLFGQIRDGIICNGVPFSKGQLKELVTALYPEPSMDRKNFTSFYTGYVGANQDELEDANVALSKLGMLGQGDMGPAGVIALAQNAKANGKNMMMDRDPGRETWNQPIQKITDVAYVDDLTNEWSVLTSAELTTSAGKPEQISFLTDLASVESELTQNLLKANGVSNDRLCTLRKKLGEDCNDLGTKITMSAQVDVLNRLKKSAFLKSMVQPKQEVSIVNHEMIVEYGTENTFASNAPDQTLIQSYHYTALNVANADGSDGAVIRSQWSPPTNTLKTICANPGLAEGRNSTSMTRGFDLKQKCSDGKLMNPTLGDHEYFTGAVPPNSFKVFRATPQFSSDQGQQQKAYRKLLEFMGSCDRFDQGVDFLKHLDQAALNNQISNQESDELAKEYVSVKKLLDSANLRSLLENKYQGVQGVDSLKSKLKL